MDNERRCAICNYPTQRKANEIKGDTQEDTLYEYNCPVCGHFYLTEPTVSYYLYSEETQKFLTPEKRAILSFAIRKMHGNNKKAIIDDSLIENILKNQFLPTPAEQADNLILYVGDEIKTPGRKIVFNKQFDYAKIGAINSTNFSFIRKSLIEEELLAKEGADKANKVTLTFDGWRVYEKLKKGKADSNKAFMAMPFDKKIIDNLFHEYQYASEKAGFVLIKNDDNKKAGSIDDKIRVNILNSKFIIAELTHGNQGAYWEAGYAEGLGKPVIYSCKKKTFDEKKTHFDTNHLHTVLWEEGKLEEAADELKSVIRATLPADSILEDKEE